MNTSSNPIGSRKPAGSRGSTGTGAQFKGYKYRGTGKDIYGTPKTTDAKDDSQPTKEQQ